MDNQEDNVFSEETIQLLKELGIVLQKIYNRMISEGYHIANGKIVSIADYTLRMALHRVRNTVIEDY